MWWSIWLQKTTLMSTQELAIMRHHWTLPEGNFIHDTIFLFVIIPIVLISHTVLKYNSENSTNIKSGLLCFITVIS